MIAPFISYNYVNEELRSITKTMFLGPVDACKYQSLSDGS